MWPGMRNVHFPSLSVRGSKSYLMIYLHYRLTRSIVFSVNYINMVNELYSGTVRIFPLLRKRKFFSNSHLVIICLCSAKF